jgi:predicted metalloprotease with PDZ domain
MNSPAISFNGDSLTKEDGYLRWLSYVAYKHFHNFNVKRIRPLALGPFDYDRPNLTDMLWFPRACRSTTRIWCWYAPP